jgi:hypothetical protein
MKFCSSSFHAQQIDSQDITVTTSFIYFRKFATPQYKRGFVVNFDGSK